LDGDVMMGVVLGATDELQVASDGIGAEEDRRKR